MSNEMVGRTAIVTGGGSGIGYSIAQAYVEAGAYVIIAGRSAGRLEKSAKELGSNVRAVVTDVTNEDDVRLLFEAAAEHSGAVDVLVNCAGAFEGSVVDDLSLAAWRTVLDVNVTGVFLCAREAFRYMRPRGEGRIINIGSIAGSRPRENSTAYAASKHAVWGLTQALSLDGRADGIVVSCLNPGNTQVERRANAVAGTGLDEGPEPMMAPEQVGRLALLMATLPPDVNILEATMLPVAQRYVGRG